MTNDFNQCWALNSPMSRIQQCKNKSVYYLYGKDKHMISYCEEHKHVVENLQRGYKDYYIILSKEKANKYRSMI